jgi:hypothetical protein
VVSFGVCFFADDILFMDESRMKVDQKLEL